MEELLILIRFSHLGRDCSDFLGFFLYQLSRMLLCMIGDCLKNDIYIKSISIGLMQLRLLITIIQRTVKFRNYNRMKRHHLISKIISFN